MKILVTSFSRRSIDVWKPMFDGLGRHGIEIETIWFPRLVDPDHRGLFEVDLPNRLSVPIDRLGKVAKGNEKELAAAVLEAAQADPPDLVLCCTPNLGPESRLRTMLSDMKRRPPVMGLQHDFVQWWPFYETACDLDYFGAFGEAFIERMPVLPRDHIFVLASPKLDLIPQVPQHGSELLFLGQEQPSAAQIDSLLKPLGAELGLTPVIRPHPEHRSVYARLVDRYRFSVGESLVDALSRAGAVVSTGSTAILEALVMGKSVAVLPYQGGEEYLALGIVAATTEAGSVLAVLQDQESKEFARRRGKFLESYTGSSKPDRAYLAATRHLSSVGLSRRRISAKKFSDADAERNGLGSAGKDPIERRMTTTDPAASPMMEDYYRTVAELAAARRRIEDAVRDLEVERLKSRGQDEKLLELQAQEARSRAMLDVFKDAQDVGRTQIESDRDRAKADADAARADLRAIQQELEQRSNELASRAESEQAARERIAELEPLVAELDESRSRLQTAEQELQGRSAELSGLSEAEQAARERIAELEPLVAELDETRSRLQTAEREFQGRSAELSALSEVEQAARARIAELELSVEQLEAAAQETAHCRQLETEDLVAALDESQRVAAQVQSQLAQSGSDVARLWAERDDLAAGLEGAEGAQAALQSRLDQMSATLEGYQTETAELRSRTAALDALVVDLRASLDERIAELERLQADLTAAEQEGLKARDIAASLGRANDEVRGLRLQLEGLAGDRSRSEAALATSRSALERATTRAQLAEAKASGLQIQVQSFHLDRRRIEELELDCIALRERERQLVDIESRLEGLVGLSSPGDNRPLLERIESELQSARQLSERDRINLETSSLTARQLQQAHDQLNARHQSLRVELVEATIREGLLSQQLSQIGSEVSPLLRELAETVQRQSEELSLMRDGRDRERSQLQTELETFRVRVIELEDASDSAASTTKGLQETIMRLEQESSHQLKAYEALPWRVISTYRNIRPYVPRWVFQLLVWRGRTNADR